MIQRSLWGATLVVIFALSSRCAVADRASVWNFSNMSNSAIDTPISGHNPQEWDERAFPTANISGHHRSLRSAADSCTLSSCNGIDLHAAIKRDFKPWHDKGGITARDIDAAEKSLHKVDGYIRVSILGGQLYASHIGRSWGTRDGVFLVSLLEMLRVDPSSLPEQVEFVLSTMDRTQISTNERTKDSVPFAIGFATAPGFLEVPIPDPSFWAWPEMLIPPYWEIINDQKILPWKEKSMRAFWRGGTARNSGVREVLIHCGKDSRHRNKASGVTFDLKNAVRNWPKTWAGPMDTCQYKLAVFAQGYGFTSAKERNLACGSVPIFVEHDKVDTYFGRWLKEDVHFKRLKPESMCADLDDVIDWVVKDDAGAKRMGEAARTFAETVFSKDMLNGYVAAVLKEVASLQHHTPSTRGMEKLSHKNIADRFDFASKVAGADKGATKDGQKGGPVEGAIAALQGKPCPEDRCPKCCYRSPKAVAATGQDVEAETKTWWARHKNGQFAFWKVQRCKDDEDPKACAAALNDEEGGGGEASSSSSGESGATIEASARKKAKGSSSDDEEGGSSSKSHKGGGHHAKMNKSPDLIKLMAKKKHVSSKMDLSALGSSGDDAEGGGSRAGKKSSSSSSEASAAGAKAFWKIKLEKQRQAKGE